MTIPKIELVYGSKNHESILLMCTGCKEHYVYSVRQYKGDFGCNISEFEHFLQWAKGEAAKHECFLSGRMGYMPPIADEFIFSGDSPGVRAERRYVAFTEMDFPQVETREEDPWGGVGYTVEPETIDALDQWLEEFDDEDDDLEDDWIDLGIAAEDEELILPPYSPLDAAKTLDFRRLYEMGPTEEPFGDNYDWDENRFDFLYGEHEEPDLVIDDEEMDKLLLDAGVYHYDARGNLRDEKGRCLACLRHGVHR